MESNIVLVSGALATPKFWQYQEAVLRKRHHIHHVNSSSDNCIIKMEKNFAKIAPYSFNLIGFSMINSCAKLMSEKGASL